MSLTRIQIINEGLSQVGRSDLTSNARLWLNLFLEKVYKRFDWPGCIKDNGIVSISDGMSFPTDYWKFKEALLLSGGVVQRPIFSVDIDRWAQLARSNVQAGTPQYVWPNENTKKFYFYPAPLSALDWHLWYYQIPTISTHTNSSGDGLSPTWFLDDEILIRAIQLKALYFNDDTRYSAEEQALMGEIGQAHMNSHDKRGGYNKLKMGKSFRNRF